MRHLFVLIPAIALFVLWGGAGTANAGPWERCGVVSGPVVGSYNVKVKHTSCATGAKVSRKWQRRVLKSKCNAASCTAFGYQCIQSNRSDSRYVTSYRVKCQRGSKHVVWKIFLD